MSAPWPGGTYLGSMPCLKLMDVGRASGVLVRFKSVRCGCCAAGAVWFQALVSGFRLSVPGAGICLDPCLTGPVIYVCRPGVPRNSKVCHPGVVCKVP